ncbi:hypothetical protein [Larkinella terrae]|uniref:Uncharacterized protein n=1 Tax=Larkinella terrae TaxID=2025311 RepID=A0A7K0EN74_9BACT|nr:hypothetical protein [Larkinella terrae]MRS63001.1 hypothetical protein [Larkinella terrae]
MIFQLKKLTFRQVTWLSLIGSLMLFTVRPCPGNFCSLGDFDIKVSIISGIIIWMLFVWRYIKSKFNQDDLWAVRIGEIILFLLSALLFGFFLRFTIIRLYCLIAPTEDYKLTGYVINIEQSPKSSPDAYFMTLHTTEGKFDFFANQKSKVSDKFVLLLHRTSWGVVYGDAIIP